ncbi:hypothetical protein [Clostridium beijerinckii]|uniref:Uncharacterized protein n=1 Tax=Clostridium beijerinckii TaxID=1520 RepID=A0AAX0B564_CLOBE|nr:hypothetical protein [Clostridium beijerinckii]NRT90029.1 hypothetical protein [Clostridium beijerinckii]NYC69560.1 hypothetical protein [Clostridium beijerinckii]
MDLSIDQKKAIFAIKKYLNVVDNPKFTDDYILTNYDLAIDELIENASKIKSVKIIGVSSMSESNQSMSFQNGVEAWAITPGIEALLPTPYAKLMG